MPEPAPMHPQKAHTSQALTKAKPTASTKQGNGSAILPGVDGRSWAARRYRELCADLAGHVGGADMLSAPQEAIIRRAAQLLVWAEACEAAYARGEDFDIAAYTTCCNAVRRLLADLGLERKARDVTPDLREYLGQRARQASDEGAVP